MDSAKADTRTPSQMKLTEASQENGEHQAREKRVLCKVEAPAEATLYVINNGSDARRRLMFGGVEVFERPDRGQLIFIGDGWRPLT
jgi:hypothetical protein